MIGLREILFPLEEDTFLGDYFEKQALLYIPGSKDKFRSLMDWDTLNVALDIASVVRPQSFTLRKSGVHLPSRSYSRVRHDRPFSTVQNDPVAVSSFG